MTWVLSVDRERADGWNSEPEEVAARGWGVVGVTARAFEALTTQHEREHTRHQWCEPAGRVEPMRPV
jgi:hypothetical protein